MKNNDTNVAIILARSNSKGIPHKNLKKIGNCTLVAHAINAALKSNCFNRVVVSTDGELIAEEASKYGAEVVYRPAELSDDTSKSIDGLIHALKELDILFGSVTLLQPTSPLRTFSHIKEAFQLFLNNNKSGSVVSVCAQEHHPFKMLIETKEGIRPLTQYSDLEKPRQFLPKVFRPNGAIYINDIASLLNNVRFFIEPVIPYQMNEMSSIDIDTQKDIDVANKLYNEYYVK